MLSGGRYDKLMQNFGQAVLATGMAIGIRQLITALGKNAKSSVPVPHIAYIVVKATAEEEHKFVSAVRAKGKRVSKLFFESEQEIEEYCKKSGIKEWHVI